MADVIRINCPHCKVVMDIQPDWDGCDSECPQCHTVFRIRIPKETDETKAAGFVSRLATISNSDLHWLVAYFRRKIDGLDSAKYSSAISSREKVLYEIHRRMRQAKELGDAEKRKGLLFPLSLFASLICKHRKLTKLEQFLSYLDLKVRQQLDFLQGLVEEARRKEEIRRERARRKEETRRMNEKLARKKNEVADFAALVHRLHAIPSVNYPHMNYQQNEHPCLVIEDVCGVSCSKVGESYHGGTLVVTNKRVFFISPTHRQVYRLQNLIEYFSDWDYYNGTIKLSTSEKKSEQYQMPGVWKAAFVISYFCDPMFRQSILQGSEGQAKATILSKVEASIARGSSYRGNLLEEKTDGRRRSSNNYVSDKGFETVGKNRYKVDGITYTDVSGQGLLRGMVSSFTAGLRGEGVITGWDKINGTWDAMKRSAKGE